ncbi:LuxR C-terminal-related transcriptional regulator [Hyphomicrobium sp. LHD-15]|uniref:LuxR C-terminal-related transcriptional regulator n=1 Tax=Hyphomicrobium sp. LHD-15 TaxID=3072142 RepID=UPI00280EDC5D|nr:LuxR C-terminal-related transcriptional regulator [Hyphomicrobium sp. LHD-15]MDQ8700624.1 LuxR C-terminal-related transcriptional regulator [Hyphomicrobium sp. LHD-15]
MTADRERLSDIIGSIYDCVILPDKWPETLQLVISEFRLANAALTVHDTTSLSLKSHIIIGFDSEMFAAQARYAQEMVYLWGGPRILHEAVLEEPLVQSNATPREGWHSNGWCRDICEPRGLHDAVCIPLVRNSQTLGVITFGRYLHDGEFEDDEIRGLRLIAPHLRRAVTISQLLKQDAITSLTFSDVLDKIASGAVLVDEAMSIVHANAAAQVMLKAGEPISARDGKLDLRNAVTNTVLRDAVAQAARRDPDLERRSIDIPARFPDGLSAVIQVLPLRHRSSAYGIERRAAAAIFIASAADPPRLPADAVALLYDLTPAELRVFELIVAGKTLDEISKQLTIALPTAKSHLGRVFDKTGCSRQSELIALAARVRPLV